MDTRGKIIFSPKLTRKPDEPSVISPHEELEFHFDEGWQKWYYEADDLVSVDDSNNQNSDEAIAAQSAEEDSLSSLYASQSSQAGAVAVQPIEDEPCMKYPDAFRLSQSSIDRINSKKNKPVHYDEDRDLYYVIYDDEDDGLIPYEETVVGPTKGVKSDKVSVTNHGVFSSKIKSKNQSDEDHMIASKNRPNQNN